MTWDDAIDYAASRSAMLPSIEMCDDIWTPDDAWTSSTYDDIPKMAHTTNAMGGRWHPDMKTAKRLVVLCNIHYTSQILSYRSGDISPIQYAPLKKKVVEKDPIIREIQRKYVPRVYTQAMLAKEYNIPVAHVNQYCQARTPYVCYQCGEDKNGSEVHTETHHVFPGCTVEEAVLRIWPNYKDYETD